MVFDLQTSSSLFLFIEGIIFGVPGIFLVGGVERYAGRCILLILLGSGVEQVDERSDVEEEGTEILNIELVINYFYNYFINYLF